MPKITNTKNQLGYSTIRVIPYENVNSFSITIPHGDTWKIYKEIEEILPSRVTVKVSPFEKSMATTRISIYKGTRPMTNKIHFSIYHMSFNDVAETIKKYFEKKNVRET